MKHEVCNECLTAYIHTYNESRKEDTTDFLRKKGMVRCPMPITISAGGCETCSEYYSNVDICRHVVDNKVLTCLGLHTLLLIYLLTQVLDTYIEGIKDIQRLDAFADYQYQLNEVLANLHASSSDGNANTAERTRKIEMFKKHYQLQNLAKSLKQNFPDARQCGKCGYGPLDKVKCDNLRTHHNQVITGEIRYDNSCPGCKAPPPHDWNELPLWNGKLPNAMLDPQFGAIAATTGSLGTKGAYSWAEYLIEFCGVNGEVACSIGEKITAEEIGDLDDYYRQVSYLFLFLPTHSLTHSLI